MNTALKWLINLAVIYGIVVGVMLMTRRSLIYPFDQKAAWTGDLPDVLIEGIDRPDGSRLVVWAAEPDKGKPLVFYFMGNVGNLEYFVPVFRELRSEGIGLVAMAYRGGGGADGQPSEIGLKEDAEFLWNNLEAVLRIRVPPKDRYIYGQSLGAGIAVDLAAKTDSAGVILVTPFTRLCKVVEYQMKIVPACALMWDEKYPAIDQIGQINAPVLILHGTDDETIPYTMSDELLAAAPGATRISYDGGRHNDLRLFGSVQDAIAFMHAR